MGKETFYSEDTGEFFADFIDHVEGFLIESGITSDKASEIAINTTVKLSETFAGEKFYISRKPYILARQLAMYNDLKHMPYQDVDKKYNVSHGYSLKVAEKIKTKRQHRQNLRSIKS